MDSKVNKILTKFLGIAKINLKKRLGKLKNLVFTWLKY
jgi:hypothetical protein